MIAQVKRAFLIVAVFLVVLLLGARVYLPYWLHDYVQRTLNKIPEYRAAIGGITVHLWRGAYRIEQVKLEKATGKVPVPFFDSPLVDLSLEWRALLNGAVVGKIVLLQPHLNFVEGPTTAERQIGVHRSWQDRVTDLFPLRIDRFDIKDGEIHYRDLHSDPQVDVYLKDVQATALNLTNSKKIAKSLMATLSATGSAKEGGRFALDMNLDPLKEAPTFDLKAQLEGVPLTSLNDLFRAYANFTVVSGMFDVYGEFAAADDRFDGYAKPFLKDVRVEPLKSGKPFKILWEGVVSGILSLLQNPQKETIATKIPISGSFSQPQPNIWSSIGALLQHGFIQALFHGLDTDLTSSGVKKAAEGD